MSESSLEQLEISSEVIFAVDQGRYKMIELFHFCTHIYISNCEGISTRMNNTIVIFTLICISI